MEDTKSSFISRVGKTRSELHRKRKEEQTQLSLKNQPKQSQGIHAEQLPFSFNVKCSSSQSESSTPLPWFELDPDYVESPKDIISSSQRLKDRNGKKILPLPFSSVSNISKEKSDEKKSGKKNETLPENISQPTCFRNGIHSQKTNLHVDEESAMYNTNKILKNKNIITADSRPRSYYIDKSPDATRNLFNHIIQRRTALERKKSKSYM